MEQNTKRILLSNKIRKNFLDINETVGYIAGWETDDEIFCMSISACTDYFLPGLEVIGFFCQLDNSAVIDKELLNICEQNISKLKVEWETPVILFISKEKQEGDISIVAKLYSPYYSTLSDIDIKDIDHNPAVLIRSRGQIPLILEVAADPETFKENIELAIERLRTIFQSQVTAFLLHQSKFLLHSAQDQSTSNSTLKDLLKSYADCETVIKFKSKKSSKKKCPIDFDILIQTTGDAALENTFNHSIVIHCQRREFRSVSLPLSIDVIVVCHESSTIQEIYKELQNAIDHQLVRISECLLKSAKAVEIACPVTRHFYPDMWDFPTTLIYPLNKTDKDLEHYRIELHKHLLLPLDRPFLKTLNAHDFMGAGDSGHLFNPHEGLTSSGVVVGKASIVQGRYAYHHYMQDHMDDSGWGCAYRSLQTIISWFKFNGYTEIRIPTHQEIQEALVEIGDKPQTFIGSKKWIGSQEVSFCLDHFIQVQSKIMFVSSGAEMANKGRELFNHFRDQGTPVMIGGGVLAHTILGVDFNQDTGDLKFLILDPHYTGSEDLGTVLNKGWCGWKGISFWDQNAFYNMCLPQRPQQI